MLVFVFLLEYFRICESAYTNFCLWEDGWLLTCPPGQVIVAEKALFGRMNTGRCIKENEFIGCENDVLFAIDRWCSGRQQCSIPKDDIIAYNTQCRSYLQMYSEVEYTCLQVSATTKCSKADNFVLDQDEGFLSSHLITKTGCGSSSSPWTIVAMAGQTIDLGIIDFGSELFKRQGNHTFQQEIYGFISDGKKRIAFGRDGQRERQLYKSRANILQIEVSQMSQGQLPTGFIIHFQKIGCPDLTPPAHAWYKRDGDQAVIGCEWSQKTWHLSCDGHSWSGVVGNCSEPVTQGTIKEEIAVNLPPTLWLVCLISVSVVVIVIVCVTGIVCIKKHRIKQDVQKYMTVQRVPGQGHYDLDPNIEMASMLYLPYKISEQEKQQQQQQQGTLSDPHRPTSYLIPQDQVVNELTPIRIWERPLPDIPDKQLASGTESTYPSTKRGRTPGDGDEAVYDRNDQGKGTLQI